QASLKSCAPDSPADTPDRQCRLSSNPCRVAARRHFPRSAVRRLYVNCFHNQGWARETVKAKTPQSTLNRHFRAQLCNSCSNHAERNASGCLVAMRIIPPWPDGAIEFAVVGEPGVGRVRSPRVDVDDLGCDRRESGEEVIGRFDQKHLL